MLKTYSYIIDHDFGLAPNPFGGYCTLAVCKPVIRKSGNLQLGDWVIGTGSKQLERITSRKYINHLIYAMQVEEILSLEDYWKDPRFGYKKPVLNGSLISMYGDNIYHKDENGKWLQENSAHSNKDGSVNNTHLSKDISGKNVLISKTFYYFGDMAVLLPESLFNICHVGIGQKIITDTEQNELLKWLKGNFLTGIHGEPTNWIKISKIN